MPQVASAPCRECCQPSSRARRCLRRSERASLRRDDACVHARRSRRRQTRLTDRAGRAGDGALSLFRPSIFAAAELGCGVCDGGCGRRGSAIGRIGGIWVGVEEGGECGRLVIIVGRHGYLSCPEDLLGVVLRPLVDVREDGCDGFIVRLLLFGSRGAAFACCCPIASSDRVRSWHSISRTKSRNYWMLPSQWCLNQRITIRGVQARTSISPPSSPTPCVAKLPEAPATL